MTNRVIPIKACQHPLASRDKAFIIAQERMVPFPARLTEIIQAPLRGEHWTDHVTSSLFPTPLRSARTPVGYDSPSSRTILASITACCPDVIFSKI